MGFNTNIVNIASPTPEARQLWAKALELAEAFGSHERWSLVGGLMVQLHAFEHSSASRPTMDIDFLGDSRRRPPMTERIAEVLVERGGEMAMPPVSDEDLGYKFEVDGEIIEVLGSEGVRNDRRRSAGTPPSRSRAAPRPWPEPRSFACHSTEAPRLSFGGQTCSARS